MKSSSFIIVLTSAFLLFSCVSNKKFTSLQTKYTQLQGDLSSCNDAKAELARQKASVESDKAGLETRVSDLNKQIEFLKENNTTVLKQLQDLSVLSSSQAESIKKIFGEYRRQRYFYSEPASSYVTQRFAEPCAGDEPERRHR
jgi:chemotaxis protein MotB